MTTTSLNIADQKLLDGQSYTVSQNTTIAQDASTSMLVENPADSGTEMVIYFAEVIHEGVIDCAVYTNVDSISGGSAEDIAENNVGGSSSTGVSATTDATYTTSDEHHRAIYAGTDTQSLFDGYKMVVQPGNNVVIELTNPKSNDDRVGIRMSWVEKPT